MVLFLALSVTLLFVCLFVCASNISGTAEGICAKFTGKSGRRALLLARMTLSVKVKGQGHAPETKKRAVHSHQSPATTERNALAAMTSCSGRRNNSVAAGGDFGGLRAVYVW